jgi:cruciform cutting endonuclease 1
MPMHDYVHVLDGLKLSQLQSLAVSLGTQCSGTKTAIKSSIREILPRRDTTRLRRPLSIVSIDMGIRNLAYAHLTADLDDDEELRKREEWGCYRQPRLCVWEKIAIAPLMSKDTSESESDIPIEDLSSQGPPKSRQTKVAKAIRQSKNDAFAPHLYAVHAVSLIKCIMAHKPTPTHILIERQRFRSGGSPIVQDWSIRVGVFEGMLYAVLRTLAEMNTGSGSGNVMDRAGKLMNVDVEGILPGRVVRYWTDRGGAEETATGTAKLKGKAMKKFKIDVVGQALEDSLRQRSGNRRNNTLTTIESASTSINSIKSL